MKRSRTGAGNINAAVWLIGLGILWLTDMWWPGILILIGVSMLVQVMIPKAAEAGVISPPAKEPVVESPQAVDEKKAAEDVWGEDEKEEEPAFMKAEPDRRARDARLPKQCPACGGPVAENAHKVEWSGPDTAKCPFCDTVLKL
jgi:hypothetical protein